MDNNKDHIKQYTASDIQRYLKGQLSGTEMNAMEKAALDDPFLADAMEGMGYALEQHNGEEIESGIAELQTRVSTRTTATAAIAPVRSFRWWQVAAAAAVIVIAGASIYLFSEQSNKKREVAAIQHRDNTQLTPSTPVENSTPAASVKTTDSVALRTLDRKNYSSDLSSESKQDPFNHLQRKKPEAPATSATVPVYKKADTVFLNNGYLPTVSDPLAGRTAHKTEDISTDDIAKRDSVEKRSMANLPAEVVKTKEELKSYGFAEDKSRRLTANANARKGFGEVVVSADKKSSETKLTGTVKGVVIDNNNNPQAYALLRIDNNKNAFSTDNRGNFNIPAGDSAVNISVTVNGYGTQNFTLSNNTIDNQLKLQPANAAPTFGDLRERQYYNFDTTSRKDDESRDLYFKSKQFNRINTSLPHAVVQDAEPVYGWMSYQQYLEKNRKLYAPNTGAPAEVVVSFQVNKSGELSNFKVEQSLSKQFDDEAIRLIKEGPSWKLLKGRKTRVTIIVRF